MIFTGFKFLIDNFFKIPLYRGIPLIFFTIFIYPLSIIVLYLLKIFVNFTILINRITKI
ncbi:hypothetical protein CM15mP43_08080 [bacterium]|jgi:hypothetical protein|nr:MAG: hypothetical protein CM15mP43_08080 [bacterium]